MEGTPLTSPAQEEFCAETVLHAETTMDEQESGEADGVALAADEVDVDEFALERAMGICNFVNESNPGFMGILKHRLADFKVFETGKDGLVACPSEALMDPSLQKNEAPREGSSETLTLEAVLEALSPVIADGDVVKSIFDIYSGADLRAEASIPSPENKSERTRIHQSIRELFQGKLQSETANEGTSIRIYPKHNQRGGRDGRDERNTRPADHHRFLKFVLYKENMDTIEAIQTIAKRLHMNSKDFSYAGTKDRRGHTAQWVVARNVTPAKVLGINKLFNDGRLTVSNLQAANDALSLGDLRGNRFELVIRDISEATEAQVNSAVVGFARKGFINYFGLQRFGCSTVPSHLIGSSLLTGNWDQAISLILDPRDGENDGRAVIARRHWKETGDAKAAHSLFPYRYTAERQILAHFARAEGNLQDKLGAIMSINRELRMMYVHSVQSWIWNRMASSRHASLGKEVKVGDLVMDSSQQVITLTADNIADYSSEDLILPMPGYSSTYPENGIGEQYQEALKDLGISDLQAAWKPKNKALWDLPGAYRKVYTCPEDVKWRIVHYENPDEDIQLDGEEKLEGTGHHVGLVIAFTLPSSSYATMAIRELMHGGTDPKVHKSKTKRHKTQ